MTYALVPVGTLGEQAAGRVRQIYETGFAGHLRSAFASLTDGSWPGEIAFALTGPGQEPCGFAMLRPLGPTGWIFLRYFVVDAAQRGQGLGGTLWELLTRELRESGYSLLVFDVEDPGQAGCGPAETQIRSRRIGFYRRLGASVLPVTGYRNPPGDAAQPDWTPMLLMAAGLGPGEAPAATAGGLRAVVGAVYRYRWSLAPDHPQVTGTELTGLQCPVLGDGGRSR